MSTRHATISTDLGDLLVVAATEDGADAIIGLYFPEHWYPPSADAIGDVVSATTDPLMAECGRQLTAFLSGKATTFDLPLRTKGDPLSERVWDRLVQIPYGETITYGALATELGNRNLAQRVGQCVGHNPISIVIPCHRVVGADGSLTGFAGGLDRKRRLLELESPSADEAGRLF